VARVNGANSGALYVQETGNITGYRRVSKPAQHTWRSFAELLVNSMPPRTKVHYQNKIVLFEKWWRDRGYAEGIPDEAAYEMETARRVPSWRRVCKSLLRNDWWCKGLGFSQHKSEAYKKYLALMERRKSAWLNQGELFSFKEICDDSSMGELQQGTESASGGGETLQEDEPGEVLSGG
jgi:predicted phosphoadenosine phosphosulfate sulfurtransferase